MSRTKTENVQHRIGPSASPWWDLEENGTRNRNGTKATSLKDEIACACGILRLETWLTRAAVDIVLGLESGERYDVVMLAATSKGFPAVHQSDWLWVSHDVAGSETTPQCNERSQTHRPADSTFLSYLKYSDLLS